MSLLTWEPIFNNEDEKSGGINKVRFIMQTTTPRKIELVLETYTSFRHILDAIDSIEEMFGNEFDTMVDTGALTLAETVQLTVDNINDSDAWDKQIKHINTF